MRRRLSSSRFQTLSSEVSAQLALCGVIFASLDGKDRKHELFAALF